MSLLTLTHSIVYTVYSYCDILQTWIFSYFTTFYNLCICFINVYCTVEEHLQLSISLYHLHPVSSARDQNTLIWSFPLDRFMKSMLSVPTCVRYVDSPVWMRECLLSSRLVMKAFWHTRHSCGASPGKHTEMRTHTSENTGTHAHTHTIKTNLTGNVSLCFSVLPVCLRLCVMREEETEKAIPQSSHW